MKRKPSFGALVREAKAASQKAYAPYSQYQVGAALLTKSGKIITGANVEISSYSLTMCAERVAIFKATSAGERQFIALAVAAKPGKKPWPCGACRQVLWELAGDIDILVAQGGKTIKKKLSELIPNPF